jgi:hypothetical protein
VKHAFAGGFDLDGVLARTDRLLFQRVKERGLIPGYSEADYKTFHFEENFDGRVTREDVYEIFNEGEFFQSIPPCPYLVDAARRAYFADVELHIVTARFEEESAGIQKITTDWLEQQGILYHRLAFVKAKEKAAYCTRHNLDFFIEDRLDTATAIANTTLTESYLVALPYNEPTVIQLDPPGFRRRERPWFQKFMGYLERCDKYDVQP